MPVSPDVRSGGGPDAAARKATIRTEVLAARRALDRPRRDAAARHVLAMLTELVGRGTGPVAAYVPVGAEPGGPDLPAELGRVLSTSRRLLLPVLRDDNDLDWAGYGGTLVPAGRGLHEPPGRRLGTAAVADASLLVVPAVAVDRRGVRLGRGGGSYDRALARVGPATMVVALLHDGELRGDDLPAEPHDRRVGAVITPAGGLVRLPAA